MSQHHENSAKLDLYGELEDIVSAMKNLAQVELHRINRIDSAQRQAYATTLRAMASVLTLQPALSQSSNSSSVLIVLGSQRGFCGGFNEQIVRAAQEWQSFDRVVLVGDRLSNKIELKANTTTLPAPATTDEILLCVHRIIDLLAAEKKPSKLALLYHGQHGVEQISILPHPELPIVKNVTSLQLNLSSLALWRELQSINLQQGLMRYLLHSLKTENRLRLQQMNGAKDHLEELSHSLRLSLNRLRQQEIVEEIEVILGNQLEAL